jgi:AcrR family transcriptional regulator
MPASLDIVRASSKLRAISNLGEITSPGLRERNKAKRRDAVLDAALDLLDRPGTDAPTTEQIAERAEVSVATVYNLVGTREQLLMALVDRLIGDVAGAARELLNDREPVAALRELIAAAIDLLTSRTDAHRKVILHLTAAATPDLHTKLSPATAFTEALRRAQDDKVLRDDLSAEALAFQLYLSFNGALLRWAAGALTDERFKAAALHGLGVVLAASATTRGRPALLVDLRALGERLGSSTDR